MNIRNFNNIKIILALFVASLLTYGVSSKFYHFIWQRNSWFDKEYYYPTPSNLSRSNRLNAEIERIVRNQELGMVRNQELDVRSVEEIEKIIRGCKIRDSYPETSDPDCPANYTEFKEAFEDYKRAFQEAEVEEFKELFEDYKNALNNYQLKRDNFVFRMSIITTIIVTTLLYLYLKKGLRSKIFISLITASCVVYLASANFYKLGYRIVFTYPSRPDYKEVSSNLFNEYDRLQVIKQHAKAAQKCKENAQNEKKQFEEYEQLLYNYPQNPYYYRDYQTSLKNYKHYEECYQENKQIENLTKEYQSAITNYRKNLSIFSFVMAIITTGLMNVFSYGYLRKTYHDQQSSNIEENELNQLSYSSSSSGSSQVLSFEQWLDQNPALQYFSKEKQTEAYQKYLELMRVNALSFEEWLSQNPALQYFSEQQQHQAYQSYLSTLG